MIEFLVWLLIVLLIFGLIYYAITLIPLPAPFRNIVLIVLIIIFILILVAAITGTVPVLKFPH